MSLGTVKLRFRVLSSVEALESFAAEYRALYESSDASPYLSYEWIHAFISHEASEDDICICIGLDDEGPVAAVPLIAKKGLLSTRLELLGQGPATHNAVLVLERARHLNVLGQACSWLQAHHLKWDYCLVDSWPEDSALGCTKGSRRDVRGLVHQPAEPSQAIQLPLSWNEYLASVSKKQRKTIKRMSRKLEAEHEVRMIRAGLEPDDAPQLIELLIEDALNVCRRSWQGTAAHGVAICDPDAIDFFRQCSRSLSRAGMLDLAVLYADDSPIAFSWGVTRNGLAWISAAGFDAELRALGPGTVLDSLVIQDSIQRGMTQLDWGNEFVEYKKRWCNRAIPLQRLEIYAQPVLSAFKRRLENRWNRSIKPILDASRAKERISTHDVETSDSVELVPSELP